MDNKDLPSLPLALLPVVLTLGLLALQLFYYGDFTPHIPLILGLAITSLLGVFRGQTWMDIRDALAAGKTTAIIATGGVEPNGPWLVPGKHNYVLDANCEAIERNLGRALCAPIVKWVPEGDIEPRSGHMRSPGTISLRQETFEA